jgi:hypothetical protein
MIIKLQRPREIHTQILIFVDLVNMLDGVGIGIDVGKQLINCLLFADDIALIAETEEELQRLLDVASAFVIKWNLSFNFNKSKVTECHKASPKLNLLKFPCSPSIRIQ